MIKAIDSFLPSVLYDLIAGLILTRADYPVKIRHRKYIRPSFAQQGEDLVLDRVLKTRVSPKIEEPGIYADVGAFHPILSSVTHLLHLRGWSGIAIDPSPTAKKLFQESRPNLYFSQSVVGEKDLCRVPFYLSSEEYEHTQTNSKFPGGGANRRVYKNQVNLDSELLRSGLRHIDVLCLDIEGAELEVLSNLNFNRWNPRVVVVEIHASDLQKVLQSPVAKILLDNDYRLVASCVITHFFVR